MGALTPGDGHEIRASTTENRQSPRERPPSAIEYRGPREIHRLMRVPSSPWTSVGALHFSEASPVLGILFKGPEPSAVFDNSSFKNAADHSISTNIVVPIFHRDP